MDTEQTHKQKKCPRCGAMIPGFSITCPDCGFTFDSETDTSKSSRTALTELQDKLLKARNEKEKALLINAFAMPNTKDALLQLLILSFSNFSASKGTESVAIRRAWLSKALQAYKLLKAQAGEDADIKRQLEEYKLFEDKKAVDKLSGLYKKKIIIYSLFACVFFVALVFLLIIILKNPVQKYVDKQDAYNASLSLSKYDSVDSIFDNIKRLLEIDSVQSVVTYLYSDTGRLKTTFYKDKAYELEYQDKNNRTYLFQKYNNDGECLNEWKDELNVFSHLAKYVVGSFDVIFTDYYNNSKMGLINYNKCKSVSYNKDNYITSITFGDEEFNRTYTIEYNARNLPINQTDGKYSYSIEYDSQGNISKMCNGEEMVCSFYYKNSRIDSKQWNYFRTPIQTVFYTYNGSLTSEVTKTLSSQYYNAPVSSITNDCYECETIYWIYKKGLKVAEIKCSILSK